MSKTIGCLGLLCIGWLSRGGGVPVGKTAENKQIDGLEKERHALVKTLSKEISDQRVLDAVSKVPRHRFVPPALRLRAYENRPLPIGNKQTISQPFIVAYMTQSLRLTGKEKVLEIGTGSGYQAAVLAETAGSVFTVEIIPSLAKRAEETLTKLGYTNIKYKIGDGFDGWSEHAPYDAVMVTASPKKIPQALVRQLREGGRLSIPLTSGRWNQSLKTYVKKEGRLMELASLPVAFVPMTGKAEKTP